MSARSDTVALYIKLGDEQTGRVTFDKRAIRIGSQQDNDLVLRDGNVDPHHCELAVRDPRDAAASQEDEALRWHITAFAPLAIDGEPVKLDDTADVRDGAKLALGRYTIVLALTEPALSREPTEARLLADILAGDDAAREVYADWLDDRGRERRAEYVRLSAALAARGERLDESALVRLRDLCADPAIDFAWRRRVGRPLIQRCHTPNCPRDWGSLAPTGRPDRRRCGACQQIVRYHRTTSDARYSIAVVDPAGDEFALQLLSPVEIADTGWAASESWRAGSYELAAAFYPEAQLRNPMVAYPLQYYLRTKLAHHELLSLAFGLRGHGTWVGLFAMGDLGFARISQRPHVLAQLLAYERIALPDDAGAIDAELLAAMLAEAYAEPFELDSGNLPKQHLRAKCGLLTARALGGIDEERGPIRPVQWLGVRDAIHPPRLTNRGETAVATFFVTVVIDGFHVRIDRMTVTIDRATYALTASREPLATLACAEGGVPLYAL